MNGSQIWIGTSGWSYPNWSGGFYPDGLPASSFLKFYSSELNTVEINNSFYQLPKIKTLETWRQSVPDDFIFSVKANRYITHRKRLKDADELTGDFLERIAILGKSLGPILFQLPPNMRPDPERLERFLDSLPAEHRYVFEFRDPRWFEPSTFDLLREHNAAFCIYQLKDTCTPHEQTADFIYIRLHGPDELYTGSYSKEQLASWAEAVSGWREAGKDIYFYFNNTMEHHALENVRELQTILAGLEV